MRLRRMTMMMAGLALLGAVVSSKGEAGARITGEAFYVDGTAYRTVGTPTDLSNTGAPDHAFDLIYNLGGAQALNVATATPGDRDYNGGRWRVYGISFDDYDDALAAHDLNGSGDFDSDAEIAAALAAGDATNNGVIRQFVCPVIPLPGSGR
jgi:hypothetical protein